MRLVMVSLVRPVMVSLVRLVMLLGLLTGPMPDELVV
jgi:hypothetical protein